MLFAFFFFKANPNGMRVNLLMKKNKKGRLKGGGMSLNKEPPKQHGPKKLKFMHARTTKKLFKPITR